MGSVGFDGGRSSTAFFSEVLSVGAATIEPNIWIAIIKNKKQKNQLKKKKKGVDNFLIFNLKFRHSFFQ